MWWEPYSREHAVTFVGTGHHGYAMHRCDCQQSTESELLQVCRTSADDEQQNRLNELLCGY